MFSIFRKKTFIIILVLMSLCFSRRELRAGGVPAPYEKGNYSISLRIPLNIPLFSYVKEVNSQGEYNPKLLIFKDMGAKNIQAGIEIDFGYFMTSKISIGGLFGYNFLYDRGDKLLSKIPLLFKTNFFLYSKGRVDIPLSFSFGVNFWKYKSTIEHFTLQANVEFGVNVFWDEFWAVSFRTGLWLYPELYKDTNKNSLQCFVPIIVGVTYRR